jgi:hypothetical protein
MTGSVGTFDDEVIDVGLNVLAICGLNTVLVILVNVEPAFFSPSGIRTKQKVPKGVMKLVFSSSYFAIQHWW